MNKNLYSDFYGFIKLSQIINIFAVDSICSISVFWLVMSRRRDASQFSEEVTREPHRMIQSKSTDTL